MSQAVAVLMNNPANGPGSPFASYFETPTEENVLGEATVKAAHAGDKMLSFDGEGDGQEKSQFSGDQVLRKEMNKYGMPTVRELEKWLQNSCKSPLNGQSPFHTNMETYFNNQLSERFVENNFSETDINLSDKNMNNSYESFFDEHSLEKSPLMLPELQLDNLDQLVPPTDNNNSLSTTDLSVRLQEIINSISDNNEIFENINAQNATLQSDLDNLYLSCISSSKIFELPCNEVPNDVNLNNNDKSTNFKIKNVQSNEVDHEKSIPPIHISESTTKNNLDVKNKLQSAILKRKVRILREETLIDKINIKAISKMSNKENVAEAKKSIDNQTQPLRSSKRIKRKLHVDSCDCHIDKENHLSSSKTESFDHSEANKDQPLACRRNEKNDDDFSEEEHFIITGDSEDIEHLKTLKKLKKVGIKSTEFRVFINDDDRKVWQCKINDCDQICVKPAHLRVHMMSHLNVKPFKCDYKNCSRAFSEKTQLDRHFTSHLKRKDYPCSRPNCKRSFTTAGNLAAHEKLHVKPKEACKVAECTVKSRKIDKHMIESHDRSLAPYACDVEGCEKRFFNRQAVSWHQRSHRHPTDLTCKWEGCGKEFKSWPLLKVHMLGVHSDWKPFVCTFKGCQWAFATNSKLSRHRRMHENDRRYFCDYEDCDKAFLRAEHLTAHKISHTRKRLFQCQICFSNLSTKSSLATHVKKHQTRKNDEGNKKVVEEEVVCSRVQPVRVIAHRMKKKMRKAKTYAEIEEEIDDDAELIENIKNTIDLPGEDIKTMYMCHVENCSKLFVSNSDLKLHLNHSHDVSLSDIRNDELTFVVVSSPSAEENNSKDNDESDESDESGDPLVKEFDIVLDVINVDGNQVVLTDDLPILCF